MDEEFTTTAYPNVQENLKLPTEDQVILKEPASSTGTLSSLQNLEKEISFTNQFFMKKPQEEEPETTNTESEVQSKVSVPIHQDNSSVPPMTTPVIDLTVSQPISTTVQAPLPTSTATIITITTITTLPPPPPQPQQSTTDMILLQCIGELEQHIANLIQDNLALDERKAVDEIVTDAVDWAMQAPIQACFSDLPAKSLEHDYSNKLLADLDEACKKKRKKRVPPRTPFGSPPLQPPPSPPPVGASGTPGSAQQQGSRALSSSKIAAFTHQSMASATSDTRYESTSFMAIQETSPSDDLMHDDSIPDKHVHLSDMKTRNDNLPKADMRKDW
ncbi:hypothetical protein Tco_0871571 [Tanacetum coccineum]